MGWLTTVRGITTVVVGSLTFADLAHADGRWAFTEVASSRSYWNTSAAASAAFLPDGRIVVAGGTHVQDDDTDESFAAIALVRYNPDLSLDPSFSQDGKLTTDVDADRYASGSEVMLQPDGKILVAGSTGRSPSGDFVLARYRADGTLDAAFGTGGLVTTDFGVFERANAAALQRDGKVVVLGESIAMDGRESPWSLALARYRTDGSLDPSFSGDGLLTLNVGDSSNGEALAIQGDGKLLVGGGRHLLRFRPDGSLDPSFGTAGVVSDGGHYIRALGIQPDGRIVSAGHNGQFAFARYLADGTLDWSFGVGGRQSIDFGSYGGGLNGIAVQPSSGNLVAVGDQYWSDWISGNYGINFLAAGLDADGSPPTTSWGDWGDRPAGQEQGATAAAIAPDGHIVIVGYGSTWTAHPNRFLIGRLDGETGTSTVTTITSGPSGTISDTAPAFAFTPAVQGSRLDCKLDGPGTASGSFTPCTSPKAYSGLADGDYAFTVRATDPDGNATLSARSFTVEAPLDTTITSGPSGPTNGTTPSFAFTASGAGSTFECKLDTPAGAGTFAACASPRGYTTTANGTYTFAVRAVGPGGPDTTPATRTFRVDTVAPTTSIVSGPVGSTTDATPTFTFASNEPGSFECRLDTVETPGYFEPCATPLTLGPLAAGVEYALFVRAIDSAGNPDPGFAHSGLFVIDGSPPDTWIDDGPSGTTGNTAPVFTFHATLGGSTFECKLDRPGGAGSYTPCSSPQAYATPANGQYTLSVRATSNGRTDPSPATQSFTVVTTPTPTPSPNPAGCAATNGTDVPIPDLATVESPVTISSCAGNASATARVEVHVVHTYIGDLVVSLIAPDGSNYVLHNRAGGGADNLDQTYAVNLASEPANGTWRLRVQDAASADVGRIDAWTITLGASPTPTPTPTATATPTPTPTATPSPTPVGCALTNGTDVPIPDLTTVESPITITGCAGNASATATVEVHIVHTYIGDLVVSLVAPDGSTYPLHNRSGGGADNLDQTYSVNLSSEPRNGTWKLRVQDAAGADIGRIDSWTVSL